MVSSLFGNSNRKRSVEVVCSFQLVQTKQNVAYHLQIFWFPLGSRLTLHIFGKSVTIKLLTPQLDFSVKW